MRGGGVSDSVPVIVFSSPLSSFWKYDRVCLSVDVPLIGALWLTVLRGRTGGRGFVHEFSPL
jgi:hypothetical protein